MAWNEQTLGAGGRNAREDSIISSYKEESKLEEDVTAAGCGFDFEHNLHRGLKSRQIAMVKS